MGLRQLRLADEIRDIVARCFQGGTLSDPRLKGVTVTAVKLSPDLQIATVYYRVYDCGDELDIAQINKGLDSAAGFLKQRLAKGLDVRRIPDLRFFYDKSVENASKIEELLKQI